MGGLSSSLSVAYAKFLVSYFSMINHLPAKVAKFLAGIVYFFGKYYVTSDLAVLFLAGKHPEMVNHLVGLAGQQ